MHENILILVKSRLCCWWTFTLFTTWYFIEAFRLIISLPEQYVLMVSLYGKSYICLQIILFFGRKLTGYCHHFLTISCVVVKLSLNIVKQIRWKCSNFFWQFFTWKAYSPSLYYFVVGNSLCLILFEYLLLLIYWCTGNLLKYR